MGVSGQQIFDMLMESQFWPAAQMREYQQSQVEQLLRHAKSHVPFYKTRLDCVFRKDGTINWPRWQEIPILSRSEVANNFETLQAAQLPEGHGPTAKVSTSGSTGIPIRITSPQFGGYVNMVADWRAFKWWNFDWNQNLVQWHGDLPAGWQARSNTDQGSWGLESGGIGKKFITDIKMNLPDRLKHLADHKAHYLHSQANYIFSAAHEMMQNNLQHKLQALISFGVTIEDEFRHAAREAFAAPIRAMYSSKEAGRIAYSCPTGHHYHVNSELAMVEILDENNQPCRPEQSGRVVVTSFLNTAQPFIRYEQGDRASWGHCSCGIRLPVIAAIEGRTYHGFTDQMGQLQAMLVGDNLRSELQAEFWQFVQHKAGCIEVNYKPVGQRSAELEEKFTPLLIETLGRNYDITYRTIDKLPLTVAGKFIKYLNSKKPTL